MLRKTNMTLNEPDEIRSAFSCFATGVAVATTVGIGGRPVGITVSSFNSVSIDPPLLLWSIAHDTTSFEAFSQTAHFAVHILGEHQRQLSDRFATRCENKFADIDWGKGLNGDPILPDFSACFECSTEHRYQGGDHMIIVGRVLRFDDRDLAPLIFHRSEFHGKGRQAD